MAKYKIKTKAEMVQVYIVEAETEEKAKEIALSNVNDVIEQTQITSGEVIESTLVEE